jgi:hypothetical protein
LLVDGLLAVVVVIVGDEACYLLEEGLVRKVDIVDRSFLQDILEHFDENRGELLI